MEDHKTQESSEDTAECVQTEHTKEPPVVWDGDRFRSLDGKLHGWIYKRGPMWWIYSKAKDRHAQKTTLRTQDRATAIRLADSVLYNAVFGNLVDPGEPESSIRKLNPGSIATRGAIAEYAVVSDLMARGYEVYRAASPNSSCDLVILTGNKSLRVEVKSGTWDEGANNLQIAALTNAEQFDLLAVYYRAKNEIRYRPSISDAIRSKAACFKEMLATGEARKIKGMTKEERALWKENQRLKRRFSKPSKYFPELNQINQAEAGGVV